MITLPARSAPVAVGVAGADEALIVRRCAQYRRALRVGAMSMPADALKAPSVAQWTRRRGVGVHTSSPGQLEIALNAGIEASRISLHCNDDDAYTHWGIQAGAGRLVVRSQNQLDAIADVARTTQRVMVDLSTCADPHLVMRVASYRRLELIGVHHRLTLFDERSNEATVGAMIAAIACVRKRYGHIVTRLSFAGIAAIDGDLTPRKLRAVAEELETTVEEACARFRYPRPALVIALQEHHE